MSYDSGTDSHIRDKVKLILVLPNNATKKELMDATSVDTSNLAVKVILLFGKLKLTF